MPKTPCQYGFNPVIKPSRRVGANTDDDTNSDTNSDTNTDEDTNSDTNPGTPANSTADAGCSCVKSYECCSAPPCAELSEADWRRCDAAPYGIGEYYPMPVEDCCDCPDVVCLRCPQIILGKPPADWAAGESDRGGRRGPASE